MLNEIQSSDQFSSTISYIDITFGNTNVFIGTSGFYDGLPKTMGIPANHVMTSKWNIIKDTYPLFYERQNIDIIYNHSDVTLTIANNDVLCSMDACDIILKWQELWDNDEPVLYDTLDKFSKKVADKLIEPNLLNMQNNKLEIQQDLVSPSFINLQIFRESDKKDKKPRSLLFNKKDYYQTAIIRGCKQNTIQADDLWNYAAQSIEQYKLFKCKKEEFEDVVVTCIEYEYIVKHDNGTYSLFEY